MFNLKLDNIQAKRSSLRWRKYWSDQISSYCEFGTGLSPTTESFSSSVRLMIILAPVNFAFWVLSNLIYYADDEGYPSCPP